MSPLVLTAAPSGSAGPLGLLVVLLIGLAMVLLIRNMNKRLRRLPRSFEPPARSGEPTAPPADAEPPA